MGGMMRPGRSGAARAVQAASAAAAEGCPAVSQVRVDGGKGVFGTTGNCFSCHGGNAKGTAAAPDLTDENWLNIDGSYGSIVRLVRSGVPRPARYPAPMPPEGGTELSDGQVCSVAAYVFSLSH